MTTHKRTTTIEFLTPTSGFKADTHMQNNCSAFFISSKVKLVDPDAHSARDSDKSEIHVQRQWGEASLLTLSNLGQLFVYAL